MWNFISITHEMFKRYSRNTDPLLEVLTRKIMSCEQVWPILTAGEQLCFIYNFLFLFLDNGLVVQHQSTTA